MWKFLKRKERTPISNFGFSKQVILDIRKMRELQKADRAFYGMNHVVKLEREQQEEKIDKWLRQCEKDKII